MGWGKVKVKVNALVVGSPMVAVVAHSLTTFQPWAVMIPMGRINVKSLRGVLVVVALAEVVVGHLPRIVVRSDVGPPHPPRSQ